MYVRVGGLRIGRPRLGIALGSGAARGWAHIGILRALDRAGVHIDVVSGCSAGAVIGAFYAAGALDVIEKFAENYKSLRDTFRYLDFSPRSGGLVAGRSFIEFLKDHLPVHTFHELKKPFAVVATDLVHMEEVQILEGPLLPALRASVAVPGFLSPLESGGRQLVDGGLLNPVPVSLARRLGADIVIAADLDGHTEKRTAGSMREIMGRSIDTMRHVHKVAHFRAFEPDILIQPSVTGVGFMDYHKTADAIAAGEQAALSVMQRIQDMAGTRTA